MKVDLITFIQINRVELYRLSKNKFYYAKKDKIT